VNGIDHDALLKAYRYMGFQATNFGLAVEEINRMRTWRLSDEPAKPDDDDELQRADVRAKITCKIFFGYTSNVISSGQREIVRALLQHKCVHVVCTTAGGIEEDFIKCLAPTFLGDFALEGAALRPKGLNRIGNLLVPNDNYCKFEDWFMPLLNQMHDEQERDGTIWSPSKIIARLGKAINNEESVYYWAYKNNIPVYCPALTDGSIGDMIYFHSYKRSGFIVDIAQDIKSINNEAVFAKKTGMIILGGALVKHHICNANLMRNGADFAVFVNTGQEFDGSDAGAKPDEAKSWGKIKLTANPVKVYADASLVFPLLVAQTFAHDIAAAAKQQKQQSAQQQQQPT